MRIKIYTIYDKTAGESTPPFLAKNDGVAIRTFMKSIPPDVLDYKLYSIGTYDMESMAIEAHAPTEIEILI